MIPFVKAHACGNDFLIVEEAFASGQHAELARKLCSRNFGVGADGVEYLSELEVGGFAIRLFNADGSEAEISGNGTRCVAAWLQYSQGLTEVKIATHAGVRSCRVISAEGHCSEIETEMGVPTVEEKTIVVNGEPVDGAAVSVGNPHFVIFVGDDGFRWKGIAWETMGAAICTHEAFPQGTNVEFVRVIDAGHIEFRIFERGVGPTSSSGTGTCASAAASIAMLGVNTMLKVTAPGGRQRVVWPDGQSSILLTGPAEIIARGEAY